MLIQNVKFKILVFIMIGISIINITPMTIYAYNNYWSREAIADFIHNDIILSDNILNDDKYTNNITREEFSELIVSMYSISAKCNIEDIFLKENPFDDTDSVNVQRAYSLGLVNGISKENYEPESNITREQLTTIITRFLNITGIQTNSKGNLDNYPDNESISEWAYNSMLYCVNQGFIKGYLLNYLRPQGFVTIEQTLIILDRIALKNEWITPSEDAYCNGFLTHRENTEFLVYQSQEDLILYIEWIKIKSYEPLEEELRYILNSKLTDTNQINKLIETVINTDNYHLTNSEEFEKDFEINEYEVIVRADGSINTKKNRQHADTSIFIKKKK